MGRQRVFGAQSYPKAPNPARSQQTSFKVRGWRSTVTEFRARGLGFNGVLFFKRCACAGQTAPQASSDRL